MSPGVDHHGRTRLELTLANRDASGSRQSSPSPYESAALGLEALDSDVAVPVVRGFKADRFATGAQSRVTVTLPPMPVTRLASASKPAAVSIIFDGTQPQ